MTRGSLPLRAAAVLVFAWLAAAPAAVGAQIAPGLAVDQQLLFLERAKVVSTTPIGKGTTGALRVTLSDGAVTHDAAFQRIATDPIQDGKLHGGERRFADHYRYNVAAWRLAVLLGLGSMMPATVERRIAGQSGALSWWVDDVAMDEAARDARKVQPPDAVDFSHQRQRMVVFAELVRDMDRNQGNVVYTRDWRLIMLDFTRAFRIDAALRRPDELSTCDRGLLAAMRGLTSERMAEAVGAMLRANEIRGVLARRDLLVGHFDRLIAERGEGRVLY